MKSSLSHVSYLCSWFILEQEVILKWELKIEHEQDMIFHVTLVCLYTRSIKLSLLYSLLKLLHFSVGILLARGTHLLEDLSWMGR